VVLFICLVLMQLNAPSIVKSNDLQIVAVLRTKETAATKPKNYLMSHLLYAAFNVLSLSLF
jgi:hypothetical protein